MGLVVILIGVIFIGVGFLIKAYPNTISGYNTMSPEKKKNVDIEKLSTHMRNCMIAIGVLTIIGYYVFKLLGLSLIAELLIVAIPIIGIIYMVIKSQKFNRNKKTKTGQIMLILILVGVVGILTYGYIPAKIAVNDNSVTISGIYGVKLPAENIDNVSIAATIPEIKLRTNGVSFAGSRKGYFSVEDFGRCRLFAHSTSKGPYLILTATDGLRTIIKTGNAEEADNLYKQIDAIIRY